MATPRPVAKQVKLGGWKSLDFLGFSRPNRTLSMGYKRFSAKIFSCPFLGHQGGVRRARRAVGSAFHAARSVRRSDTLGVEVRDFLLQSELDRAPVPSPAIMRSPRVSGKKLSVILIHGFAVMGNGAPTRSRRLSWRRWRCRTSAAMSAEGARAASRAERFSGEGGVFPFGEVAGWIASSLRFSQ